MPGSETLAYLFNINNQGAKTQITRVYTAPQGVQSPTQLAGC